MKKMLALWSSFDEWLDEKLPNAMNHAIYSIAVILAFYFWIGWYYVLAAYISCIAFFYASEVKQAMDTQSVPFKMALKFWLWQKSKKEDVQWVILLCGLLVGFLWVIK